MAGSSKKTIMWTFRKTTTGGQFEVYSAAYPSPEEPAQMRHVPSSPADGSGSDGSEAGDGSPQEPAHMEPTSPADGSDGVQVSPFDVRDGPEGEASSRPCGGAWCERAWGSFADEEGDGGGEDDGQDERGCSQADGSDGSESGDGSESLADGSDGSRSESPEPSGDDSRSSSESEPSPVRHPVRLVAKRRQLADGSENRFPVDGEKGLPCIMFGYRFPRPIMSHIGLLGFSNAAKQRVLDLAAQKQCHSCFLALHRIAGSRLHISLADGSGQIGGSMKSWAWYYITTTSFADGVLSGVVGRLMCSQNFMETCQRK